MCGPAAERLLFTPAPNPVADPVWSAMRAAADLPSGGRELDALLRRLHDALAEVTGAPRHLVLTQTGTATAAIESAVRATTRPGETVAVVSNGQFGDRIVRVVTALGRELRVVHVPWGVPTETALDAVGRASRGAALVAAVHHETSTGVRNDARAVSAAVHDADPRALVLLDAVSSAGEVEVELDAWGVDIAVCGSSKGLGSLPGASFCLAGSRALDRVVADGGSYATSWARLVEAATAATADVFLTPSIPVLAGVEAHLTAVVRRGHARHLEQRAQAHAVLHEAAALPPLFPGDAPPGPVAVYDALDARHLQSRLAGTGLHVGRGQGPHKARAVRLSWFGHAAPCADELRRRLRAVATAGAPS